jgi:hypothetical protein
MKIYRILVFSIAQLAFASPAIASGKIDILLVFADDLGLSSTQKQSRALTYQTVLSDVYENQLNGSETVVVHPFTSQNISYNGTGKTLQDAITWMKDQNAIQQSLLRTTRDSIISGGADVILMVVPNTPGTSCGESFTPPTLAGTFRSESHAFSAIIDEQSDSDCFDNIVIPHEIGHLLYAEHQVDLNGDDVAPDPRNHATENASSGQKSLMWDVIVQSGGVVYGSHWLSGYFSSMTSSSANNVDYMSEDSFDIVSGYREPPPTLAYCEVKLVTCNGSTAMFAITPYINESYPITNVHMDTKKGAQLWSPQYDGPFTCPTHGDFSSFWYQIFINTAYGSTYCSDQVYVNPVDPCQQDPW